MTAPRTVRWGIVLAFVTAAISGLSIFLNGLFVKEFPDPLVLTGVRNGLVGLAFVMLMASDRSSVRQVARLTQRQLLGLVALAVVGGSVPFFLFFGGLAQATSPGAAFIQKTLFVWVAVLAVPLLGESIGRLQVAALGGLLAGSVLLAPPGPIASGTGEAMILLATLFWSVEVVIARRLLPAVPVRIAATARMALGAVLMLGFLGFDGRLAGLAALSVRQWLVIGATGGLLLGYVASWYGALQRAPATTVTSILVVGAVVTGVLQSVKTSGLPAAPQAAGLWLILIAALGVAWLAARRRPVPDLERGRLEHG